MSELLERVYEDAERRLGRELTRAERHIDVIWIDNVLRTGKAALTVAIERERTRAFQAELEGKRWQLQVTQEMTRILEWLHETGREIAEDELTRMGYEIGRMYADEDDPSRRVGLLQRALTLMLQSLGLRIRRVVTNLRPGLALDILARRRIEREAEKRVPGSKDIAGRLVSGALYSGLGATFEEHEQLIPCWEYSAIMDNATCAPCREADGRRFNSWAEAMLVLPAGGPNPRCLGDGRCRCRLVPCLPDDAA